MATISEETAQRKSIDLWILPLVLIVGIVFILAYRNYLVAGAIHYGDVTPFPKDPQSLLDDFIYTWNPVGMGHEANADMCLILEAFYLKLTNNPILAQQLFLFTPLPISALFMYILLSHFTKSRIARYIGSIIYAINPQVTYGGPPGPWIQAYSTFPIIIFFLIKMLESQKLRQSLLYVLLFSLFFAYATIYTVEAIFVLAFPFFIIVLSSIILKRDWKYAGKAILLSGGGAVLTFLIVAAYVLPMWTVSSQVLSPAGIEAYLGDLLYTYYYCNIQNLMSVSFLAFNPFGYNQPGIVATSGLILPLLAFSSLFLIKDSKRRKYVISFSALAVVVIGFNWLLHLKPPFLIELVRRFPILLVWRAPKATYLTPLAYCPLIALSLEEILKYIPKLPFIRSGKPYAVAFTSLFIFLILSSLAIYNWPIVTGDVGASYLHYPSYSTPPSFYNIAQWIDQHRYSEGFFRTLWLPWSPDIRNTMVRLDPYHFGMPMGVDISNAARFENYYLATSTFEALYNQSHDRIGLLLALANVKYIIVSFKTVEFTRGTTAGFQLGGGLWLGGDPDVIVDILQKQHDLSLIEYNDEYAIFRNDDWYPYLNISSEPVLFMDSGTEFFTKLQGENGISDTITITNLSPNQRVKLYDYNGTLIASSSAAMHNVTIDLGQNEVLGYIKILNNEEVFCESSIFKISGGDVYGYTSIMQANNAQFSSILSVSTIPNFNLQNNVLLFKSELPATLFKSILKEVKTIVCVGLKGVLENTEILKEIDKDQTVLMIFGDSDYQILGQKKTVKDPSASRGFAVKIGEGGQLSLPIHIFRDDQYRIIIRGSPNTGQAISSTINGDKIFLSPFESDTYSWFQTPPISLKRGICDLNITVLKGASIMLDQVLVVNSSETSDATANQVMLISEPKNLSDWSSYGASLSLSNDAPIQNNFSLKMQTDSFTGDDGSMYNPIGYWNWSEMDYMGLCLKYSKNGIVRVQLFGEANGTEKWRHWDLELEENQWTNITLPLKARFTAQSDLPLSLDHVDSIWIAAQNLVNESVTLQVTDIYVPKLDTNRTGTLYQIFSKSNSESTIVDYTMINRVELKATISTNSPVFIIFGETFNKGWEGRQGVSEFLHFKVNAYGNGYYVNSNETFTLDITFAPQQLRNYILLIDALMASGILAMVFILAVDRDKIRYVARMLGVKKLKHVESLHSH